MRGKTINIDPALIKLINEIEEMIGQELTISSGHRSTAYNIVVGGVSGSEHTYVPFAKGVDIETPTSQLKYKVIKACYKLEIRRIGDGDGFVHVGIAEDKPQDVFFDYYDDYVKKPKELPKTKSKTV